MNKVIAAIATPAGSGGVAVIRISGTGAAELADRVYRGKNKVSEFESHLMHYGCVCGAGGALVDKVLCVYMKAPHSYTGEDTVEIHCHGGFFVSNKVLETVLEAGAAMALPGEFTKRAFLNGRLNLSQAEAVSDLISAKTDEGLYEAVNRLEGALSEEINAVRDMLLDITAQLLVTADYPEEDIDDAGRDGFSAQLASAGDALDRLLATANAGKNLQEGVSCAIVGRPNTGKSSLLNALSGVEKAIVTERAGTTRDVVEACVSFGGVLVNLRDTAGIREADDEIEKIGIAKTKEHIRGSDLCIIVLDGTSICKEDEEIIALAASKKHIIAINKNDLPGNMIERGAPVISISAKTGDGLNDLKKEIAKIVSDGQDFAVQKAMITSLRQKEAVMRARESISEAIKTIADGFPADLAATELENAVFSLGEVTGQTVSDEVVEKIFSKFCLGK